jgi:probable HAF family extracellular repeat protein
VAVAVNANGQVVGRSDTIEGQPPHALSWTQAGGMVDLGTLVDGTFSQAYAVNASGQVVGFSETMEGQTHAFAWTQAFGIVDLGTLVGGTFSQAQAVNDSGQVVGHSGTAMGFGNNAVLWTLPVRQLRQKLHELFVRVLSPFAPHRRPPRAPLMVPLVAITLAPHGRRAG